jgi:hypothetical protein
MKKENKLLSNMGSELEREIQMRMKILPPINASKLMRRSRLALQRVVMFQQIMFKMPNATAQLMTGPLFKHDVFLFSRVVGEDVLRDFFSTEDFLW